MLLVDTNVLLYSLNVRARQHQASATWLAGALAGSETVAFPWLVLLGVLRLATHPAIFGRPLTPAEAFDATETWIGAAPSIIVEPTARHMSLLRGLVMATGTAGKLVVDAHLAALALEHDATVVSFDRDFARFEGVRTLVPGE